MTHKGQSVHKQRSSHACAADCTQIHLSDPIDHVSPAMQVAMLVVHAAFAGFIILLVQFININSM